MPNVVTVRECATGLWQNGRPPPPWGGRKWIPPRKGWNTPVSTGCIVESVVEPRILNVDTRGDGTLTIAEWGYRRTNVLFIQRKSAAAPRSSHSGSFALAIASRPSLDVLTTFGGVCPHRISSVQNVKCHLTGPVKLLGQVRRLELHKNEEMIT